MTAEQVNAIAKRSLVNCHAEGVDSIVLSTEPMIRAFIAHDDHTLWRNTPGRAYSVGFHNHHCDIQLFWLLGAPSNEVLTTSGGLAMQLKPYRFESPIAGKSGKFYMMGPEREMCLTSEMIRQASPIRLKATDLHTIWAPRYLTAAWLVIEGAEHPTVESICWSNDDLERWSLPGMYLPMSVERATENLKLIGLV